MQTPGGAADTVLQSVKTRQDGFLHADRYHVYTRTEDNKRCERIQEKVDTYFVFF